MAAKMIGEIASLVLGTAEKVIAQRKVECDDPMACLRGSLMWAMLSVEIGNGTSRDDLLKFVGRMYDILHKPDTYTHN